MSVEIIKVKENSIHTYPLILCCTWASFMSNLGISAVAKIGEKERRRKVVDWAQEVVDKPYNDIKAVGQLVDSELRWYLLKSLVELFRIRPVAHVVTVITIPALAENAMTLSGTDLQEKFPSGKPGRPGYVRTQS